MLDAVRLERKGLPVVVLCNDTFEVAARTQAKIMGLASIKIVVIPVGNAGQTSEQHRAKIDKVWTEIVEGLTGRKTVSTLDV